ncbi:MAG: amino acid permease [Candidatus Diapherotrites archaeon]|uniref:Amino acid permease n=1 Tax=Candidatus Iainarchaeum sp. TaxID=3101447 RepID=A0A938YYI3_9ARCH|nr:amino acid permease [Candidatus Diapherotrites archaeon]
MRHPLHQPKPQIVRPGLHRSINLWEATIYGVGIILGAGIYALIGEAAGIAGNALWLSFILSSIIAAFTALSYAELSGMFPREAAEYVYMQASFRRNSIAFLVSWIALFAGVVSVAAVALGFAGYFTQFFPGLFMPAALGLIAVLSVVNFVGIKESAIFNTVFTLVETAGLFIIVAIGIPFLGSVDYFEIPAASESIFGFLSPIAIAAALIFFAYIGFEDLANITEETVNPRKTIPAAMLLSLAISTVLYILVSVSAVSVVGWQQLSESAAPMALVAQEAFGQDAFTLLAVIALFSTANTVLIILIAVSRRLYGMSEEKCLPSFLQKINGGTRTPFIAIALTMVFSMAFVLLRDIRAVAFLANVGIFVIFFSVNCCVIALRYAQPGAKRTFRVPFCIGRFPILPLIGAVICLGMLLQFPIDSLAIAAVAFAIGLPIYYVLNRKKRKTQE